MPCQVIELEDGTKMIACSRGQQPKPKCYICGRPADFLCDYVLEYGLENPTCDRPICNQHRVRMGPGIDYCPEHAQVSRGLRNND